MSPTPFPSCAVYASGARPDQAGHLCNIARVLCTRGQLHCATQHACLTWDGFCLDTKAYQGLFIATQVVCSIALFDCATKSSSLGRRYELHHGVRISDSALVEAAELSSRYIAGDMLRRSVQKLHRYHTRSMHMVCMM